MAPYPDSPRSAVRTRTRTRALAAGCAALLTASVSGCSSAQKATTGLEVGDSVAKLGEQPAASVVVSVDGTTDHAYAFLRHAGAHPTRADAARVARAELTLAVGSGSDTTPLKDVPRTDGLNLAGSLNFGGTDAVAVKSVDDKCYVRLHLDRLADQAQGTKTQQRTAARVMKLAGYLPRTLGAAKDALKGQWVRVDPNAFGDFARAAETLSARTAYDEANANALKDAGNSGDAKHPENHGGTKDPDKPEGAREPKDGNGQKSAESSKGRSRAETARAEAARAARALREAESRRAGMDDRIRQFRKAAAIGSALDGQSQREFISGVQKLLRTHAHFTPEGRGPGDGTRRVRMTLPGRQAAGDLTAATAALGVHLDPRRVPDGDIHGELLLRRGQLASLTLDLGQFTDGAGRDGAGGHDHGDGSAEKNKSPEQNEQEKGNKAEKEHDSGEAAAHHLPLRLDFSTGEAVPTQAPGGARTLHPQDVIAAAVYGALGTRNF